VRKRERVELDGVGKKSGIKLTVYSQHRERERERERECSLLLGSNISRRSPLRGRVGSFSRGGRNNRTLYRAPGAQSQHPYIIIHTGKKAGGTFAERKGWGTAELSRHPEYSASSIFRTYREITSCPKVNFSAIYDTLFRNNSEM